MELLNYATYYWPIYNFAIRKPTKEILFSDCACNINILSKNFMFEWPYIFDK